MTKQQKLNPSKVANSLWDYFNPLWVSGLAVFCVLLGNLLWGTGLGLQGEQYELSLYLTLGMIFPALCLALSLPPRFLGFSPTLIETLKLAFVILLIVVSVLLILVQHQYFVLVAAAMHLLLIYTLRKADPVNKIASLGTSIFCVIVSWTAAVQFLWWSPDGTEPSITEPSEWFDVWFLGRILDGGAFGWIYPIFVLFLSLLLVFVNLYPGGVYSRGNLRFRFRGGLNIIAILIFGMASVNSGRLFDEDAYHHWGVYVGPAEMVRQGGWLLWDVPSQYGFLSTLAIAFLPAESAWQSLYIVNSLLLFLSAVFLFFILRSLRGDFTNFCFSLAVTLAAVFLISGWAPVLTGPQVFPSAAAFRFFWCYALLGILVWEFRADTEDSPRWLLWTGCVVWLIGTLWSSESAIYCAAIWLPSYTLIILRKAKYVNVVQGSLSSTLRSAIFWFAIPPLLLLSSVGVIGAYYMISLGRLPDWSAFVEYSISYGARAFGALPMNLTGPVLALFLVFCAVSTTAVYLFLHGGLMQRALSLIVGTWGALWAISSYFVARSHPNNISNLTPILCVAMGLTLYVLARHQKIDRWTMFIRTSFVPVLAVLLIAPFVNAPNLINYVTSYRGYEGEVNSKLPVMDDSLRGLLDAADVKTSDPVVFVGDLEETGTGNILPARPVSDSSGEIRIMSPPRTWLPIMPGDMGKLLSEERKELYISRFTERARLSGWLIETKKEVPTYMITTKKEVPYTSSPWFSDQLQQTHVPTEVIENDDWRLTWFEYSEL